MKLKLLSGLLLTILFFSFTPNEALAQCDCDFVISLSDSEWQFDGAQKGVKPGDKICFTSGTRTGIGFTNIRGTADKPVIITNMCDGKVVLNAPASWGNAVEIQNSSHFVFSGAGNKSVEYGIEIRGAQMGLNIHGLSTNFEVNNVDVNNVGCVGIVAKTDPTCEPATWRGNFTLRNANLHHNKVSNTGCEGFYIGNSHYDTNLSKSCNGSTITVKEHDLDGIQVAYNKLENIGNDGIQIGGAKNANVHHNTVYNAGTKGNVYHGNGVQINPGTSESVISDNIIDTSKEYGIFDNGGGNTYYNNIVANAAQGGFLLQDVAPNWAKAGFRLFNNTIVNCRDFGLLMFSEHTDATQFSNNIIVGPSQSNYVFINFNNASKNKFIDTNNIKTQDINSLKFVNASGKDYRLTQSSPAVDAGVDRRSFGVTKDLEGKARPQGNAFDIGAYEFASGSSTGSAPSAKAGDDKTIVLPTNSVTLTGSGTSAGGSITAYAWTKVSGGTATLSGANTATLNVTNMVAGDYVFRLTVTNNTGAKASDDVKITVKANATPSANAGSDKTITLPTNTVTITGSGTDSDGTVASYAWTKVSGGTATLSGANTTTLKVTNMVAGDYVFRLTVTDNSGAKATDDVKVTVKAAATQNTAPVAKAGADQTITLPTNTATFSGSGTDSDGTIASYAWTKVSGGTATLTNANTNTLKVSGLVAGTYVFRLTVKDNQGATGTDDVKLTVNAAATTTLTANAGDDKVVTLPTSSVTFTGGGSGTISSYKWTQIYGNALTLANTSSRTLTVSGLKAGNFQFRLTVTDNTGKTATDDVKLQVTENKAPVANAGSDQTITLPTNTATFNGSGTDSDGTVASYSWRKLSGGTATLSNATTKSLKVTGVVAGTYVFRLTVTDDKGATGYDDVQLVVRSASSTNSAPVSKAGADQTITLPKNSVTLSGSGTDSDGTIAKYAWSKVEGGSATITSPSSKTTTVTGLTAGDYMFRLTVTDNLGATGTNHVRVHVTSNGNGVAKFNFTPTAQKVSGWVDVAGSPHVSVITATDPTSNIKVSSVSTAQWPAVNYGTMTSAFNGGVKNGTVQPAQVVETNWFNYNAPFNSTVNGVVQKDNIRISNLNPSHKYKILVGASRQSGDGTTDQYGTFEYRVNQQNPKTLLVTNNTSLEVEYNDVVPNSNGEIGISARKVNGSAMNFGYIGWLIVVDLTENPTYTKTSASARTAFLDPSSLDGEDTVTEEESIEIFDKKYPAGYHYSIVIFDANGAPVFKGAWSEDVYPTIIQPGTLYIYQVIQNGRKVDSGKFIKVN